jgi:hypothetical protein
MFLQEMERSREKAMFNVEGRRFTTENTESTEKY